MAWNIRMPVGQWITESSPELEHLINEVTAAKELAIDTETTGLNVVNDFPLYWSLSWGENRFCLPASVLPFFSEAFHDEDKTWIFANAKFDMHMLANLGMEFAGRIADTAVMHALLYEEKPHSLEFMSKDVLGWTWKDGGFRESVGMQKGETAGDALRRLEQENPTKLIDYASNDAYGTFKVYQALKAQLEAAQTWSFDNMFPTMGDIFFKIESPFTRVLWDCEREGIKVNRAYLSSIQGPLEIAIADIEKKMCHVAGRLVNPNSTPQMGKYYFEDLKLRPRMMTKGGKSGVRKPSIDDAFLEYYEAEVPMAKLHREYRELSKLCGTYVMGLQKRMDTHDRIHTRFNQDVARCMPAGELVLTSRGYLPVEQVRVGDQVIAHTGKPRRVVECSTHDPKPIYRVRLANGLELRTTGNHPYRVGDAWVRADALTPGDEVITHSEPEQWRPIEGWESFEVSSWGRVKNSNTGRVLALQPEGQQGYLKVSLARGDDFRDFSVHCLVLQAFKERAEVRHLNGIAWDNTIGNLHDGQPEDFVEGAGAVFSSSPVVEVLVEVAETTFGLTVEEDGSHVTAGIVTHNTGRLSSSDPNLQNIPRPDEDRFKLRGAFIPSEGHTLIVADYEQLEMRLLAAASGEPKMIDIFARGWDIHMGNAAIVFGKKHGLTYEDVAEAKKVDKMVKSGKLPEAAMTDRVKLGLFLRQAAKSVGFGLNYGMKENKLARQIGVTVEEAKDLIDEYMRTYPAVQSFYADAIGRAEDTGYSFTIIGKRRFLPEILSQNQMDKWQAERQAVNNEIQGTAANVTQFAMINIHRENLKKRFGCRMLLQVHDEIVWDCPLETVEEVKPIIKERMEHPFHRDLPVHLAISMGTGPTWMDAK